MQRSFPLLNNKTQMAIFLRFCIALPAIVSISPVWALPAWSLRYKVPCVTCHTVAPRLNRFGLAFQANYFNWPKEAAVKPAKGIAVLPISVIATASRDSEQGDNTTTKFRAVELYPADGFTLSGRRGGYFLDIFPATTSDDDRAGNLEEGYVALPFAGKHDELAVVAGQMTTLMYQYDPVNSLTDTLPGALSNEAGELTAVEGQPQIRLDYFNHRGTGTANGNYVSLLLRSEGTLRLDHKASWGHGQGPGMQIFHRESAGSLGAFALEHGRDYLIGALATANLDEHFFFTAAASKGRDEEEHPRRLSLEAEWDNPIGIALTGRWEMGDFRPYPVAGLTFYPLHQNVVRLSAETSQQQGEHAGTIALRVQL